MNSRASIILLTILITGIYWVNSVDHKPIGNDKVPNTSNLNRDRKFLPVGDTESKQNYGKDEKMRNSKKLPVENEQNGFQSSNKNKKPPIFRTPFDKALDKLSKCAGSKTDLAEVMHANLQQLQSDNKYETLFNAAPHLQSFINRQKKVSKDFLDGFRQAIVADWSNPKWKSADEIETIFRPLKQQLVFAMMRFNCT